jgi:Kef-type K+ transport system membrane component KefB/predicted amino acid-binding ACT domain protein
MNADFGRVLLDLVVVLIAARLAAEIAARLRLPAVLVEIVAGVLVGPSVARFVSADSQALSLLGQIGVVLLLFEVGRQLDLGELREVGGAALRVATIGVLVPMALAYPAMRLLGIEGNAALFLAAGITATSVGITARVFGDLRALATPEARIVLRAAVADDLMGLLVLTLVVRVVDAGSVDAASRIGMVVAAVGFVVVATVIGALYAPRLLDRLTMRARTDGTVMTLGLVAALGLARLAQVARLVPIAGAFVAGLIVGRSEHADDLKRRLTPLGQFFIPIFFLKIGIDTKLGVFGEANVLGIAVVLCAIAVAGKIVAGLGATRGSADRMLVGAGMIPRGEVGLIVASLGLSRGVLDARTYGVLLIVVLVSSLVTPPWIRARVRRARSAAFESCAVVIEPSGGWLRTGDVVDLVDEPPPPPLAPRIALEAAVACATRQPGNRLMQWLASVPHQGPAWDEDLRARLIDLLRHGSERSWRFLDVTGMLDVVLPDVAAALRRRPRDPFDMDPGGAHRLGTLDGLNGLTRSNDDATRAWESIERQDLVLLAALARGADAADPSGLARSIALSIGLSFADAETAALLAGEGHLLSAAAARLDLSNDTHVIDLASHVGARERVNGLYVLAVAENAMESWERDRLDALYTLLGDALTRPDLNGDTDLEIVERRAEEVALLAPEIPPRDVREYVRSSPRRYVLATTPATIARHVRMVARTLGRRDARLEAEPATEPTEWIVHVAVVDRPGLLAAIAGVFFVCGVSVVDAQVSTMRTGTAVDVFRVHAAQGTDWDAVRTAIERSLAHRDAAPSPAPVEGLIEIDNLASPRHTIVEVHAEDRTGLLYRVASAFARAGLQIHQATVTTRGHVAVDTFWVTNHTGGKIDRHVERDLRAALAGETPRRFHFPRPSKKEPAARGSRFA